MKDQRAELVQPVVAPGNISPRTRRNLSESNMAILEPAPEGGSPRTRRNLSEVGPTNKSFFPARTSSQPPRKNPWFKSLRSKEEGDEQDTSKPALVLRPASSVSPLCLDLSVPLAVPISRLPDDPISPSELPKRPPPPIPANFLSDKSVSEVSVLSRTPPPLPRARISQADRPRDIDQGGPLDGESRFARLPSDKKEDSDNSPAPSTSEPDARVRSPNPSPSRNGVSLEITPSEKENIFVDANFSLSKLSLKEKIETPFVRSAPPSRSRVPSETVPITILAEKKDDLPASDTPKSPTMGFRPGPPPARSRVPSEAVATTVLSAERKDDVVDPLSKLSLKSERAPPPSRSRHSSEVVPVTQLTLETKDDLLERIEDPARTPRKEDNPDGSSSPSAPNLPRPPTTARTTERKEELLVESVPLQPRPPSSRKEDPSEPPSSPRPPLVAKGEKKDEAPASDTFTPVTRVVSPDLTNVSIPPPRLPSKARHKREESSPPASPQINIVEPARTTSPPGSRPRHPKGKSSFSRDDLPTIASLFAGSAALFSQASFRSTQNLEIEKPDDIIFEEPSDKEDVKESGPLTNKHGVTVLTGKALKMLGVSVPSGKLPSYCKYGRHGLQETTLTVAKMKLHTVKGQGSAPPLVHYSAKSANLFNEYEFPGEDHHLLSLFRQGQFGRTGGCASALLLCSDDQFSKLMPVIGCAIAETPGWAEQVSWALVDTIKKRVLQSQVASTAVHFLKMSKLLNYSWAFNDWLEGIETESYLFDMLSLLATKEAGFSVSVAASREALHPFQSGFSISGFTVSKVFNSNARPRLIVPLGKQEGEKDVKTGSPIIIKQGDDLRQDVACLHMMCLMNSLWEDAGLAHEGIAVKSLAYGCLAVTPNLGCIQFIPNSVPLKMVKEAGRYSSSAITRLITTGAGSFVAAYVLGVRDRHHDNILICKADGSLFHIDFGHILGDETTIDTGAFAVTPDLKEVMTSFDPAMWELFVKLCVTAYKIIRDHSRLIISFATMLMAPFQSQESVRRFIADRLKLNLDEIAALAKLRDKVQSAPTRLKTKFKNVVHGIATGD